MFKSLCPLLLSCLSDILCSSGHQSMPNWERGWLHPCYNRMWTTTAWPVQVSRKGPYSVYTHFTHSSNHVLFYLISVRHRFVGRINIYMDSEPVARWGMWTLQYFFIWLKTCCNLCVRGCVCVYRPLGAENLLLRGATLKNTEYIYGNGSSFPLFLLLQSILFKRLNISLECSSTHK